MVERRFGWRAPLTEVAGEAFTIMHTFNLALGKPWPGWQAELAAPPGPSTGGGAQAMQHIALINPEGQRIALGAVDTSKKQVSLRSHAVIDSLHRSRFGSPFPVAAAAYQVFLENVSKLFGGASMTVTVETLAVPVAAAKPEASRVAWLMLALLLVVVAAGAVLWLLP